MSDLLEEGGVHGTIVGGAGIWGGWRGWPEGGGTGQPGNPMLSGPLVVAMLTFYIFGRAYDFLLIEAGALFGAMGALFYGRFGAGVMRRHGFPFLYIAFLIPPPGWAVNYLTAQLKTLVSAIS